MMNNKITDIINSKKNLYFISPHLDDAIYSSGGLLSVLPNESVTVINIFSKADSPPYTYTAKKYLKSCGYENAIELFYTRKNEDKKIFEELGIRVIYLDQIDAAFRKNWNGERFFKFVPEVYHTHPVTIFRNKFLLRNEPDLIDRIIHKLQSIIETESYIFCPLGVGEHIDHLITKKVCERLSNAKLIYWSDYPYNVRSSQKYLNNMSLDAYELIEFTQAQEKRKELIKKYRSQFEAVFPDGIKLESEKYYLYKN